MFGNDAEDARHITMMAGMGRLEELRAACKVSGVLRGDRARIHLAATPVQAHPERINTPDEEARAYKDPPLFSAISSISFHTKKAALILLREFDADVRIEYQDRNIVHVLAAARPPTGMTRKTHPEKAAEDEAEYAEVVQEVFNRLGDNLWLMLGKHDSYTGFPLHVAAQRDNELFVQQLSAHARAEERKADGPRKHRHCFVQYYGNHPNQHGETPLSIAAHEGCAAVAEALIKHAYADVRIPSVGRAGAGPQVPVTVHAMYLRQWIGYRHSNAAGFVKDDTHVASTLKVLLDAGADANTVDEDGYTLLHRAALRQNTSAAQDIILHGGNVHVRDRGDRLFTDNAWLLRDGWNNLQTAGAQRFCGTMGTLLDSVVLQLAWIRRNDAVMLRGLAVLRGKHPSASARAATSSAAAGVSSAGVAPLRASPDADAP